MPVLGPQVEASAAGTSRTNPVVVVGSCSPGTNERTAAHWPGCVVSTAPWSRTARRISSSSLATVSSRVDPVTRARTVPTRRTRTSRSGFVRSSSTRAASSRSRVSRSGALRRSSCMWSIWSSSSSRTLVARFARSCPSTTSTSAHHWTFQGRPRPQANSGARGSSSKRAGVRLSEATAAHTVCTRPCRSASIRTAGAHGSAVARTGAVNSSRVASSQPSSAPARDSELTGSPGVSDEAISQARRRPVTGRATQPSPATTWSTRTSASRVSLRPRTVSPRSSAASWAWVARSRASRTPT